MIHPRTDVATRSIPHRCTQRFRLLSRLWIPLTLAVCPAVRGEMTGTTLAGFLSGSGVSTVFATHAPGRPNDLFVVEQSGLVYRLDLTTRQFDNSPFLDIRSSVDNAGDEQGLLGLAFDPDYANNGYFYVNYTYDPPGSNLDRTRIDRYQAVDPVNASFASASTRLPILDFAQDFSNHNGGWLGFGPNDGYLYISTGDGGSGNDPNNRAQSGNTRLGKILRIDVTGDDFPTNPDENWAVPPENPLVGDGLASTLDEIWAYGLRNPWRASFDRLTGDLWIGDVGQNTREEIDFQPADWATAANYGWRLREGDIATPASGVGGSEPRGYVGPVYDYTHGSGAYQGYDVIGGYVYRGPDPQVQGRYFFADAGNSRLWTFDPANPDGTVQNVESVLDPGNNIVTPVSFGEDTIGNLYIVTRGGGIYRIETDMLIAGDYNGDGVVDARDYAVWRDNFGSSANLAADGNGNGSVDLGDYTIWRDNLGALSTALAPSAGEQQVPEPAALAIALATALLATATHGSSRRGR